MNIDSKLVRHERERRAWSQEHLAEVAGVGLRTIQRVESTGAASFETAKALAAVLEMDVAALRADKRAARAPRSHRIPLAGLAVSLLAISVLITRAAIAGQVRLDVELRMNDEETGKKRVIAAEGEDAEIRVEGRMRIIVRPKVKADGSVFLTMRLDEYANGRWALVGTPNLLAVPDTIGEVRLTSATGTVFAVAITPHKI